MKRTATEMRQAAKKFREYWTFACGREIGEDQQFWNSLLGEVLGVEDVKSRIRYQVPVAMKGTTKFLDAWIPETRVLIEPEIVAHLFKLYAERTESLDRA